MATRNTTPMLMETNERQRRYVEDQKAKGGGQSIVFVEAFLRGMRDLGYKSPVWALAEMIDNAIQAAATRVAVLTGYLADNKSQAKPDHLALIDDGVGMIPEMIRYAVMWGGTDREDDRTGFGRYGYGLPSSAVSLAKRYSVYSKVAAGEWHVVTVDIEELAMHAGDPAKTAELLTPRPGAPPAWVVARSKALPVDEMEHGTVIVLEELDRIRSMTGWITTSSLVNKLKEGFGVIYRHWIPERQITVDGDVVEATDPVFLMEHARFYDENHVRPKRVRARVFNVETPSGRQGTIRIRASVLPPNFQLRDPAQYGRGRPKNNKRFDVMKDYNGLLICREGRQIDVVQPPFTRFQNYDRNIKVEIDFDPELDEAFGITTSKQQIVIDTWMWDKLTGTGKENGHLENLISDMRREFESMQKELEAEAEKVADEREEPRPSAVAMEESEKYTQTRQQQTEQKSEEGRKNLEEEAERLARPGGAPKEEVIGDLIKRTQGQRYDVTFEAIEEGPFYVPKRLGEQKRVIINTAHPFYSRVYSAADDVKSALEVLLLVVADAELEAAEGEPRAFYRAARQQWSERLRYALESLDPDASMADKASAVAEGFEVARPVAEEVETA